MCTTMIHRTANNLLPRESHVHNSNVPETLKGIQPIELKTQVQI